MVGSDVTQARIRSGTTFQARDVYIDATQSCSGGEGVCTDVSRGGTDDVTLIEGEETATHSWYRFSRPIEPSDAGSTWDTAFTPGSSQSAVWARYSSSDWDQRHDSAGTFSTKWDDEGRDCEFSPPPPPYVPPSPPPPILPTPGGGDGRFGSVERPGVVFGMLATVALVSVAGVVGVYVNRARKAGVEEHGDTEMDAKL